MKRRGRRGDDAQAVLETALVIPILLFLICNFIAVMVQVTVQEQLNSATALAAQSRFQAPESAIDASGTRCCGLHGVTLITAGLPTGCRYAAETFYGTMTTYTGSAPLGHGDPVHIGRRQRRTRAIRRARPVRYTGSPINADVSCDIGSITAAGVVVPGYVDRTLNPPVGSRGGHLQRVRVARFREHTAGVGRVLDTDDPCTGGGASTSVSPVRPACARSTRRRQRGQTLIVFALGFALFLFSLTCLVAELRISVRLVGARAGRRATRRAIRCRLGQSQLPVRCHRSVSDSRASACARRRSSTSARRIATARCTRFSAPASRRQTSRHRYRVTRRTHSVLKTATIRRHRKARCARATDATCTRRSRESCSCRSLCRDSPAPSLFVASDTQRRSSARTSPRRRAQASPGCRRRHHAERRHTESSLSSGDADPRAGAVARPSGARTISSTCPRVS